MLGAMSFGGITFAAFDRGQHHAYPVRSRRRSRREACPHEGTFGHAPPALCALAEAVLDDTRARRQWGTTAFVLHWPDGDSFC